MSECPRARIRRQTGAQYLAISPGFERIHFGSASAFSRSGAWGLAGCCRRSCRFGGRAEKIAEILSPDDFNTEISDCRRDQANRARAAAGFSGSTERRQPGLL